MRQDLSGYARAIRTDIRQLSAYRAHMQQEKEKKRGTINATPDGQIRVDEWDAYQLGIEDELKRIESSSNNAIVRLIQVRGCGTYDEDHR